MEFCSKYGYDYGANGSDQEDIEDVDKQTKEKVTRKVRKADSNIVAFKFDRLAVPAHAMPLATKYKTCFKCAAIATSSANVKNNIWTCEYCYEENAIEGDEILPSECSEDVTFVLQEAPAKTETSADESVSAKPVDKPVASEKDLSYLTFCIDNSGSMDSVIYAKHGDAELQSTNMTRLDGVKVACVESLSKLKNDEADKMVAMVTFSEGVKYFGDCSSANEGRPLFDTAGSSSSRHFYQPGFMQYQVQHRRPMPVPVPVPQEEDNSDLLNNKEKIMAAGRNQAGNLKPISESFAGLEQKVQSLQTEGSTALGPALAFSVGFSSKTPGSQIILCTDGCANVGMGSIEAYGHATSGEKFYDELAEQAKAASVTVNVISMEGTDCRLALLGKLADKTNGVLTIVNPLKLGAKFASILENRLVATNVRIKIIINMRYLYVRDEELEAAEAKAIETCDAKAKEALNDLKKSFGEKDLGNVNLDTETTFEYGCRRLASGEEKREALGSLPFQLQVSFTTKSGANHLRVYTRTLEFTNERAKAESNLASVDLLFSNAMQKMSAFTIDNEVCTAQYRSRAMETMISANQLAPSASYTRHAGMVQQFSKDLRSEEMNDEEAEAMFSGKKATRKEN